jgi:hypothetical protein
LQDLKWLLIFNNADDLNILQHGWPLGDLGSILITTRDLTARTHFGAHALRLDPFDVQDGARAFLRMADIRGEESQTLPLALEISEMLGGLPLALDQISAYVQQCQMSMDEFLPLYKHHQSKLHGKRPAAFNHVHTIATVWDLALAGVSGDAATLQNLIAFFHPDNIDEIVLKTGVKAIADDPIISELRFIIDDLEYVNARSMQSSLPLTTFQLQRREDCLVP